MTLRKKLLAQGTRILDILVMVFSFLGAIYLNTPGLTWSILRGFMRLNISLHDLTALILMMLIWNRIFAYFGLYEIRRLGSRFREWLDIVKAVTVGVLSFAAVSYLFADRKLDHWIFVDFWAGCSLLSVLSRTAVRQGLVWLRRSGRNLRDIVIVGSNSRAIALAQRLMSTPELGYRLLGFVDGVARRDPFFKGRIVCDVADLADYLEHQVVDEVFIVLPIKTHYDHIRQIAQLCEELGIVCRVPSDWFDLKTARTFAYEIDGVPILTISTGSKQQEYLWVKWALDMVLSAVALVLLAPVLAVTSLLIKLTSPGPVLFKQERVGYNRRHFHIYKFRTMIAGAEEMQASLEHLNESDGPTFKINNDPRITPIGRWLRRASIDEIPQLINVLRGEMSLVGPRPLPLRDVEGIDERWQKRRFSMRPGLTCLWQINGRNRLAFHDWMVLDLKYIDDWSIKLDFQIMLKTIPSILRATGQ